MDTSKHNHNRFYLIGSLIAALLVPLLSLPVYQTNTLMSVPLPQPIMIKTLIHPEINASEWNLSWSMIYATGVVISLLIISWSLFKIYSIIKNGNETAHYGSKLIFTLADIPLCSFGNYIIAPAKREGKLTDYELIHETNHIKKRHTADILFLKLLRAFFWFNPILILFEKRLLEVHEYQADYATQEHLGKETYLSYLVDQVNSKRQFLLVHNFNSLIKKRLIMMSSESRSSNTRYLAILPVLLVVFSLFSFDSYSNYTDIMGNEISIQQDTIPNGPVLDTISMYNYIDKKMVTRVVVRQKGKNAYLLKNEDPNVTTLFGIDTVATIDYDTYVEELIVINHETGVIDTLK